MDETRGIFDRITTNTTDAGGKLTEEMFFKGVRDATRYVPNPPVFVTTPRLIDRAHEGIERWETEADAAKLEVYRLRRPARRRHFYRRFRFLARRRAAERYLDNKTQADALAATFGRR